MRSRVWGLMFILTLSYSQFVLAKENLSSSKMGQIKNRGKVAPKKKGEPAQKAIVAVDGTAVYEFPNFDSPVLEYLDQAKAITISKKVYPGIGGLGAFYKIRLRPKIYGYITDTDIKLSSKAATNVQASPASDEEDMEEGDPTRIDDSQKSFDSEEEAVIQSVYMNSYLGLNLSSLNYTEVLRNRQETANITMLGLRRTGPTGALGGMPLDIGLMLTSTAPSFYSKISSSTTGLMLLGDAIAMIPLYDSRRFLINYGLGLVLRYSKWQVALKQQVGRPALDSVELTIGAVGELGAAIQLSRRFVLRGDAKYYFENEKYFGLGAALQYQY